MVLVIAGALALLIGIAVTGAGATLLWANATQRDATGFFNSPNETFHSTGNALTSSVDFATPPGPNDWLPYQPLGTIRIKVAVTRGGTFVGIASTTRVDQFLAGVPHDQLTGVTVLPFRAQYRYVPGTTPPASPNVQGFWVVSATGRGVQQVTWKPTPGNWTVVVMRSDAGSGVVAHVAVGTNSGWVAPIGVVLSGGGILLLIAGGLMLGFGVAGLERYRRRDVSRVEGDHAEAKGALGEPQTGGAEPNAYPVRLDGQLDATLSRWRWLFKWFLVIPHAIVLTLLWLAVIPLTFFAGCAILFTGAYPKSIFNFNVGVIRWTWRVAFYAFSALGTDQYPPFSLEPDSSFPAAFAVDYPQHLSRGLVLVKWWLLAIPQYVIVGIFVGGGIGFSGRFHHSWSYATGGGLIALLVFVAALILAITGQYPQSIFDFVMGMNRWCYRVLAYAMLLRDEYPPFRFDPGGIDPGSLRPPAPARGPDGTETPPGVLGQPEGSSGAQ